jgi:hypothetical protein
MKQDDTKQDQMKHDHMNDLQGIRRESADTSSLLAWDFPDLTKSR